jgi:hypothetical protein
VSDDADFSNQVFSTQTGFESEDGAVHAMTGDYDEEDLRTEQVDEARVLLCLCLCLGRDTESLVLGLSRDDQRCLLCLFPFLFPFHDHVRGHDPKEANPWIGYEVGIVHDHSEKAREWNEEKSNGRRPLEQDQSFLYPCLGLDRPCVEKRDRGCCHYQKTQQELTLVSRDENQDVQNQVRLKRKVVEDQS